MTELIKEIERLLLSDEFVSKLAQSIMNAPIETGSIPPLDNKTE